VTFRLLSRFDLSTFRLLDRGDLLSFRLPGRCESPTYGPLQVSRRLSTVNGSSVLMNTKISASDTIAIFAVYYFY